MRSSLMIVALLCFVAWMSLTHASTHGRVSNCCEQWSNTRGIPLNRIRHYTNQSEGICPIKAVVFHTKMGKRICSDPSDSWAIKTISMLERRSASKLQGNKAEESTSTITTRATASPLSERISTKPEQTTLTSPGSDPDSTWTTAAAAKTDKEPQMLHMKGNNEATLSSTSTSRPKKKGRRPGRRLRKGRSGRKWMKKKVHVVCEHSVSLD
ncbi:C-C motif chemokine 2-like isoform X1 [Betta splendens]|uniref:C-C motif chemokine 2-like isoform X1 n=1 Tax=Betta splendens TaxID=158456 RepID=A0A6P7L1N0_BETSP|nr:C-C motif chemokine 2-like isoform X1 [Betta splendens]